MHSNKYFITLSGSVVKIFIVGVFTLPKKEEFAQSKIYIPCVLKKNFDTFLQTYQGL